MKSDKFGDLIYNIDSISGEAVSKAESHIPKIISPDQVKADELFEININIGPHPNRVEHSIRWIELYFYEKDRKFNPILLGRAMFTPGYTEPNISLKIKLRKDGVLYVLAYCNIHGIWENSKEIKVVP